MVNQFLKKVYFLYLLLATGVFAQNIPMHKYDFVPDETDTVIANRLLAIEKEIPLDFNKHVRSQIDFYTIRKRDYTRKMLAREAIYFPVFEKYLAKHNMPDEIKYLSVVESALNPRAESRVGALGLWQFMPSTGEAMKLKQDFFLDERRDVEKSTEAACRYLSLLYGDFHDWQLALAAYNCGPGNVRKAKRRSGKDTFWGIYNYLPRETRAYVPIFTAIVYAMNYSDEHNLFPDTSYFRPRLAHIEVQNYFNFEHFAKSTNLCLDDLMDLNPVVKHNVIPDYVSSFVLNYPEDKKAILTERPELLIEANKIRRPKDKDVINQPPNKIYHRIRSGENLGSIAKKYHVYVSDIKRWNGMRSTTIYAGKKLLIYRKPSSYSYYTASNKKTTDKKETIKSTTSKSISVKKETNVSNNTSSCNRYHTVQSGDSLWSIAKKYKGLTIDRLQKINKLSTSRIYKGQRLKVCSE